MEKTQACVSRERAVENAVFGNFADPIAELRTNAFLFYFISCFYFILSTTQTPRSSVVEICTSPAGIGDSALLQQPRRHLPSSTIPSASGFCILRKNHLCLLRLVPVPNKSPDESHGFTAV